MALYYIVVKHRISIDNFIIMEHIEYVFMNTITKIHDLVNSKHITSLTLHGKMNSKSYAMKIPPRSLHRFHKKMSRLSALISIPLVTPVHSFLRMHIYLWKTFKTHFCHWQNTYWQLKICCTIAITNFEYLKSIMV